jgi:hypothetical protein
MVDYPKVIDKFRQRTKYKNGRMDLKNKSWRLQFILFLYKAWRLSKRTLSLYCDRWKCHGLKSIYRKLKLKKATEKLLAESLLFLTRTKPRALTRSKLLSSVRKDKLWFFGDEEILNLGKPYFLDDQIPARLKRKEETYTIDKPFVCEVKDVTLVGPHAVGVTKNNMVMMEIVIGTKNLFYPVFNNSLFLRTCLESPDYTVDTAFSIIQGWGHHYFHWVIESLALLQAMEHYQKITGRKASLIIPDNLYPWQIESLKLMGYDSADCIQWKFKKVKVNRIVVPSGFRNAEKFTFAKNASATYFARPSTCFWLRERILGNISPDIKNIQYSPRIFISRNKINRRRMINEEDVMKVIAREGFIRYFPEEMSFSEQISLFSQAEIVIADGASLANVLFSKKPIVINLVPNSLISYVCKDWALLPHFQLTKIAGGKYGVLVTNNCWRKRFNTIHASRYALRASHYLDYYVDINALLGLLTKMKESS